VIVCWVCAAVLGVAFGSWCRDAHPGALWAGLVHLAAGSWFTGVVCAILLLQ
jgi:hypothetical protein